MSEARTRGCPIASPRVVAFDELQGARQPAQERANCVALVESLWRLRDERAAFLQAATAARDKAHGASLRARARARPADGPNPCGGGWTSGSRATVRPSPTSRRARRSGRSMKGSALRERSTHRTVGSKRCATNNGTRSASCQRSSSTSCGRCSGRAFARAWAPSGPLTGAAG